VPYDQIIESVFSGRGERADTLLNPQDPYATDDWAKYDTDLDKAKTLMKKAGLGDITIKLWYNGDVSALEDTALLMKQSLAEIGITADLQPRPGLQYKSMRLDRTKGVSDEMIGISLDGLNGSIWLDDPDTVVQNWGATEGAQNWARYSDSTVDKLQAEFRFSSDTGARTAAYATIQEILADSAHVLPLAVVGHTIAVSKDVTGVAFGPDSYMRLSYLKPVK